MDTISITYTSFAVAPTNIFIGKTYKFGKDDKGYYYADESKKYHDDIIFIKSLFSPIDKNWDEVLKENKNYKANK